MKQTLRESPSEKGIRLSVGRRSCAVGVSAKECQVGEALTDTSAHLGSDIAGGQNKAGSQVIRPNIVTQSGVSESDTTFQLDKRELGNWPEVRSIRECPRKTKRTSERILGASSPKGAYIGDGGGSSGHGESARTQCIGRIEGGRTNNHLQREHPQSQRRSRCIKSLEVSNAVGEIDGLTREEVKKSQCQGAAKMEGCEAVTNVVATREHQRAVRSVEYDGVMSNCSEPGCQHSVAHGTVESKFNAKQANHPSAIGYEGEISRLDGHVHGTTYTVGNPPQGVSSCRPDLSESIVGHQHPLCTTQCIGAQTVGRDRGEGAVRKIGGGFFMLPKPACGKHKAYKVKRPSSRVDNRLLSDRAMRECSDLDRGNGQFTSE